MKKISHLLAFVSAVVICIVILHIANAAPSFFGSLTYHEWETLDRARRHLPFQPVFPIYYPDYLAWPPKGILTFGDPADCLVFHLGRPHVSNPAIAIRECNLTSTTSAPTRLDLTSIHSITRTEINNHIVTIQMGDCLDGRRCRMMSWKTASLALDVLTTESQYTLEQMAVSMMARIRIP